MTKLEKYGNKVAEAAALEERPEGAGSGSNSQLLPFIFKEENMDNIVNIISSVGFPIAMALLLFWYMTKQDENHKTETASLREAINKLEVAITALISKLGG